MIIVDCEQYSDEWWNARLGIPTGSIFDKIVTGSQCKKSSSWKSTVNALVAEKLRGKPDEGFQSEWTKRGTEMEPEAFDFYSLLVGQEVHHVGLVYKDEGKEISCSPDGLIGEYDPRYDEIVYTGGLEIKCPKAGVQVERLLKPDLLPSQYRSQVYASLYITGLDYWDFMSYHPELDSVLVRTNNHDEGYLNYAKALDEYLPLFINDVKKAVKYLTKDKTNEGDL